MELYYTPRTRAGRARWMLEEIGEPYALERLDFARGDHKSALYMRLHPHGAVPALVDDDHAIFESSAICLYLADKFPNKKLAPPPGTYERGEYYQWMVYAVATMDPALRDIYANTVTKPEAKRIPAAAEEGKERVGAIVQVLDAHLAKRTYMLGDSFSAADVAVGFAGNWASMMGLVPGHSAVGGYLDRLRARPAFQRSVAD